MENLQQQLVEQQRLMHEQEEQAEQAHKEAVSKEQELEDQVWIPPSELFHSQVAGRTVAC